MTHPSDPGSFGASPATGSFQGPGQQAARGGRGPLYAVIGCVGCGVLVVIVVIVLSGIFLLGGEGPEPDGGPSSETTAPGISTERGSLRDPNPAGTTLSISRADDQGTVEVAVDAVDWDAGQVLADRDPQLEPAPGGSKYILMTATFTYRGPGSVDPLLDLYVQYRDDVGSEVDRAEGVLSENGILDVDVISDGESTAYDYIFVVPTESEPKGTFVIENFLDDSGQEYYLAVA